MSLCMKAGQNVSKLKDAKSGKLIYNVPYRKSSTVNSFNFIGMKLHGLKVIDMFIDIPICKFQIISYITQVNK